MCGGSFKLGLVIRRPNSEHSEHSERVSPPQLIIFARGFNQSNQQQQPHRASDRHRIQLDTTAGPLNEAKELSTEQR